jgi:N6-adenosine-specific RNA methylase IME4
MSHNELVHPITGEVVAFRNGLPGRATAVSLELRSDLTEKEWQDVGEWLQAVNRASAWWVGDWLRHNRGKWGEAYLEAMKGSDRAYQTLANAKWVADSFSDFSRRRENLSWAHHAEVAGCDQAEADELLDLCEHAGLNREQLRLEIRRRRAARIAAENAALGTAPMPAGRYETIVIDPPWPMEKIEREVAPNQIGFDYPTMSEEELAAFDVPGMAADNCHLFLWTTPKFLFMAGRLAEAWGFRYVCPFIWHKNGGFQPFGLPQYNAEVALYCRRGTPSFIDFKQFSICFNAPRREHSRKPDAFYDMVRRVCAGPRIDVFSREAREGFDQFGNQADKFGGEAA